MKKPRTMPRSLPEYNFGRRLWVGIVVLNVILATVATIEVSGTADMTVGTADTPANS
jgi:hypothetical protein